MPLLHCVYPRDRGIPLPSVAAAGGGRRYGPRLAGRAGQEPGGVPQLDVPDRARLHQRSQHGVDGVPDVPLAARAPVHTRAGADRRPIGLRVGDRRVVRSLPAVLGRASRRRPPGVRLGVEPRHLPHRQGIQSLRRRDGSGLC